MTGSYVTASIVHVHLVESLRKASSNAAICKQRPKGRRKQRPKGRQMAYRLALGRFLVPPP